MPQGISQDTWSGKMSSAHSAPMTVKISEQSSQKLRGLQKEMPLYLDLRTGNGENPVASWETGGALPGVYSMHSFGECPKVAVASHLSQILEGTVPQKYYLSAKACAGLLRRAEVRGKTLPPALKAILIQQSGACREMQ